MLRVLLTRSFEENNEIINKYAQSFEFVNCPLVEYENLKKNLKKYLIKSNKIVITSKYAAKLIAKEIKGSIDKIEFYVIGNLSAKILENAGGIIKFIAGNVDEMFGVIGENKIDNLIYFSGNVVTKEFPKNIKRVIIYKTRYRKSLETNEISEIKKGLNYILIFSENNAKVLIDLLLKNDLINNLINTTIIGISLKVIKIVRLYFKNALYCNKGQPDHILKILEQDAQRK